MTRAVHWHNVPWASRTACGRMIARVLSSTIERDVTAPCCLKLIGGQQPSGAATARASAVKPVERRATVAASDSTPSVIYLRLGRQRRFGQDYVRIWDSSLEPKEGLSRFERFDRGAVAHGISLTAQSMLNERADHIRHLQDYCARLESLLREVVEADDELRETRDLFDSRGRLSSAIEAARREVSK